MDSLILTAALIAFLSLVLSWLALPSGATATRETAVAQAGTGGRHAAGARA